MTVYSLVLWITTLKIVMPPTRKKMYVCEKNSLPRFLLALVRMVNLKIKWTIAAGGKE